MPNKKTSVLAGLLIVVIIVGIFGYYIISREKSRIAKVIEIEVQMEQLVRELEVSVWETANAVFYYLVEPSKTAAEEYKKQLGDVKDFTAKYKNLIDSDEENQMLAKFERLWSDSVSRARRLIELRDEMAEVAEETWDAVHEVDDIIDYKIQPAFVEGIPDLIEKEKAVREVEASIWEAVNATHLYMNERSDKARREFLIQLDNVNEFWENYKKLNRTSAEEPHIREFENLWSDAVVLMKKYISLADELKDKELAFWESIHAADDVVDFEIQTHLNKRIKKVTK
jgi:hypothetical protein